MEHPPIADRSAAVYPDAPVDEDARFRTLVQSPLRAGLLRFLHANPDEAFDLDSLMAAFGHMRRDVDNCLHELIEAGLVRPFPGAPVRYAAQQPDRASLAGQM